MFNPFKFMDLKTYADKSVITLRFVSPVYVTITNAVIKICGLTFFFFFLIELCNGHRLIVRVCEMAHLPGVVPQIVPFCYEQLAELLTKFQIPDFCAIPILFITPLLLPNLAAPLQISYLLSFIFVRKIKITFRTEKVTVTRWFIFRRSYRREGITFESIPHPWRVSYGDPKESRTKTNFFANSFVVVMRQGTKCIRIASIYDWKATRMGHRADTLVLKLHEMLNQTYNAPQTEGFGVLNTANAANFNA